MTTDRKEIKEVNNQTVGKLWVSPRRGRLSAPSPWQKTGGLCAHLPRDISGKFPAKVEDLLNAFLSQGLEKGCERTGTISSSWTKRR